MKLSGGFGTVYSMRKAGTSFTDFDRRELPQVSLICPVKLFRAPGLPPIETTTKDISSHGFYCVVQESFCRGDRMACLIRLSLGVRKKVESALELRCQVEVVRTEARTDG